ncbi:MAG TPA: hypothetical protein VL860_09920, partial [Planctomycetota bacterium]|nr:hypothetical protein [Planctomycetota bacterium]
AAAMASALLATGGMKCALVHKQPGQAISGGDRMFVVTTDFSTGAYSTINVADRAATTNIQTIHSDAVARVFGGFVYVINRSGQSNITRVNPNNNYKVAGQWTTNDIAGPDSNPQDIEFLSATKAYVLRYALNTILIMNPSNGNHLGTIDLSSFVDPDGAGPEPTDPDGKVEMSAACLHNGTLYVCIQRLDYITTFAPVGKSYVVLINTATDAVTGSIPLDFANPASDLKYIPSLDRLAVACPNTFGTRDGAIQLIDPNSNVLDGTALLETAILGDINDFVIVNATKGYVLYNDASFNLKMQEFNPSTGVPAGADLFATTGFNISGLALTPAGDQLFVGDRTGANPGVRVFNTATDAQITGMPINTGLPPFDIQYVP